MIYKAKNPFQYFKNKHLTIFTIVDVNIFLTNVKTLRRNAYISD